MTNPINPSSQIATLGGGCFWCLEAVFLELQGVEQIVSGYAGGTIPNQLIKWSVMGKPVMLKSSR